MKVVILLFLLSFNAWAIVGGVPANISDISYAVHLKSHTQKTCTAVLVASDKILTALHCVLPELFSSIAGSERPTSTDEALAWANRYAKNLRIRFAQDENFQENLVEEVIVSPAVRSIIEEATGRGPEYNIFTAYDWAMIKLKAPVSHLPIRMMTREEYLDHHLNERPVIIYGVGATSDARIMEAIVTAQNALQLLQMARRALDLSVISVAMSKMQLVMEHLASIPNHTEAYQRLYEIRDMLLQLSSQNRSTQMRTIRSLGRILSQAYIDFMSRPQDNFMSSVQSITMSDTRRLTLTALNQNLEGGCNGDSGGPVVAMVEGQGPLLVGLSTSVPFCGVSTTVTPLFDVNLADYNL